MAPTPFDKAAMLGILDRCREAVKLGEICGLAIVAVDTSGGANFYRVVPGE